MRRPSPGLAGAVLSLSVLQGLWALAVPSGRQAWPCGRQHRLRLSVSAVPPAAGRVLHQRRRARPPPGRLIWPHLPADNPAVSVAPVGRSVGWWSVGGGPPSSVCAHHGPVFGDGTSPQQLCTDSITGFSSLDGSVCGCSHRGFDFQCCNSETLCLQCVCHTMYHCLPDSFRGRKSNKAPSRHIGF